MKTRVIRRDARAKINVFLRVLSAREDGYHDLESLVVPISLADRVTVEPDDGLHVQTVGAVAPAGGGLNLGLVAALALADACPDSGGARVEIHKRIPVAAGLGGGSADAAAVLLALNELWECGLDDAMLLDVAGRIGSDVPAMVAGRSVLMSGRGELLAPAEVATFWWVVVDLGFAVRSPDAYRWWDEDGAARGPDPQPVLEAAAAGDPEILGPRLFNDLEPPVVRRHAEVGDAKARLLEVGSLGAVMTGSGSAVVGLARDREHARAIAGSFESAFATSGPPAEP